MAVRVRLVSKQAAGNHLPKFRPTDDARLRAGEQQIGRLIGEAYRLIDPDRAADYIDGTLGRVSYLEAVHADLDPLRLRLEEALHGIIQAERGDMAARTADDLNAELRRLRSPARISIDRVRKARLANLRWRVDQSTFTRADPVSAARVEARFQAGKILTNIAASQEQMVAATISVAFNQARPLVAGVSPGQTVAAVLRILNGTTPGGLTGRNLARYRADMTRGLFPRWAQAVGTFVDKRAERLDRDGIPERKARTILDRDGEKYAEKLRRARARNIARTETAIAQNMAQQQIIDQAVSDGLVGTDARKQWVTGPFDVCPICTPMSGVMVAPDGIFEWSGGSGLGPPAHPSCRCKRRLVPNVDRAPVQVGSGTPEDPFRYRFADGWEGPITPVR